MHYELKVMTKGSPDCKFMIDDCVHCVIVSVSTHGAEGLGS